MKTDPDTTTPAPADMDPERWIPAVDPDVPVGDEDWTGWLSSPDPGRTAPPAPVDEEATDTTDPVHEDKGPRDTSPDVREAMPRSQPRRLYRMAVYGGLAAAGALAVGAMVAGIGAVSGTDGDAAAPSPVPVAVRGASESSGAAAVPVAADAAGWCPTVSEGGWVSGAGPGDTTSGPGLILAMQHAMYVTRDAGAVRAMFAPAAAVASEQETRGVIATIPDATRHCVNIVMLDPDRYAVTLTELHLDRSLQTWNTTVTTGIGPGGRLAITGIAPAGGQ